MLVLCGEVEARFAATLEPQPAIASAMIAVAARRQIAQL
jgi:hypothetical protein